MSQKQIFNDKMILNFLRLRHPVAMFPILPNSDSGSASEELCGRGEKKSFRLKKFYFLVLSSSPLLYTGGPKCERGVGAEFGMERNGVKESAKWSELHQKRVCRFDGVQNRFTVLKANEGSKNSDEDFSRETVSKSVQN